MRGTCSSASRAAACGARAMTERRGTSPAPACAPSSCRPSGSSIRTCRIRIWSRSARRIRTSLWVQHHNGIFRSTDGAATWSEITDVKPSTFGFPVAVHPRDPNTAWFVPAVKDEKRYPAGGCVVVNRTRDGGKTFETLTRGLPQKHAYDLVFRHALDVDESGDRLAFRIDDGLAVGQRERRRFMADGILESAADLCSEVREDLPRRNQALRLRVLAQAPSPPMPFQRPR